MSDKKPDLDDLKYSFIGANFVMANKDTGKPVFSMKRKNVTSPEGIEETYYLFKIHEEDMDEEDKVKVRKGLEEFIAPMAGAMGFGLFDFFEVSERATEQVKKIHEKGGVVPEEQEDFTIRVYNWATKTVDSLTIGISTKPVDK